MFAKPFRVKSSTQMKGSEKKKFRADVMSKFAAVLEGESELDSLVSLRDEVIVNKIFTFSEEQVLLYYVQKDPLFMELDQDKGHFIPTVYALWKCPQLVPALTTWPPVLSKLRNGADLMLPGVIVDRSLGIKAYLDGAIRKNDVLAVNLATNASAIAVGKAALSSEDMYMSGHRGKALKVIHCLGDHVWASGSKHNPPESGAPKGLVVQVSDSDSQSVSAALVESVDADAQLGADPEAIAATGEDDSEDQEPGVPEDPADSMDKLLERCFLTALKTSARKAQLPILCSNFFRTHMVECCPPGTTLDVKKSSYKKLSKFLGVMQSDGLITVSEVKKGVESISAICYDHPKLEAFTVTVYSDQTASPSTGSAAGRANCGPQVSELYIVTAAVAEFFRLFGFSKGQAMTASEARDCVRRFVAVKGIQNKDNPRMVDLKDPVLSRAVALSDSEQNFASLTWEKVGSRILSKMTPGHSVSFDNGPAVLRTGSLSPIELTVATRSGNKKVTLIHNLDLYQIDLSEFAQKCQIGVAASSTVHDAPNKKRPGGLPVPEVLVQGNQVAFVGRLLSETYHIPKKYIRGLELAVKVKKSAK